MVAHSSVIAVMVVIVIFDRGGVGVKEKSVIRYLRYLVS